MHRPLNKTIYNKILLIKQKVKALYMFKRYIVSLCVFTCSAIISMQQKENNVNDRFLVLCKQADTTPLVNFLTEHEKNSNFNINYCDNDGTSGPLHAARSGYWNNVFYLLDNTSANIQISLHALTY